MQPQPPTVAAIAMAFHAAVDAVREAVDTHPWLFTDDDEPDPCKQVVQSDGE